MLEVEDEVVSGGKSADDEEAMLDEARRSERAIAIARRQAIGGGRGGFVFEYVGFGRRVVFWFEVRQGFGERREERG